MEDNKIRIGITQGDINGVGYEVILKTFSDPTMLELCTPIIYGSPKVAAYHRKALDIQANFSIVNSATEAGYNRLSVVNCTDDEVKVEFSKPDPEAGKAALGALERAIEEYREGLIDVIVTAPINKHTIQSEEFSFPGHTEYIEERLGNGDKSLMILMKNDFRVALVTTHIPVREIATTITKELIQEKLMIFHRCLKQDFGIGAPRIAVLSLNPHAGDGGLLGMEEQEVIIPAMKEMEEKGHHPSYIYRGYKNDIYEGGHRIPLIVSWKGKYANEINGSLVSLADFYATFAQMMNYRLKDKEAEDSYSIWPILNKKGTSARKNLIYASGKGYLSLRTPKLKLVFHGGSGGWGYPNKPAELAQLPSMQLFDLEKDPSETMNLIGDKRYKKNVEEMTQLIRKYVEEGRSTPGKKSANDTGNSWEQIENFMQ